MCFSGIQPDSTGFGRFLKNRMWGAGRRGAFTDTRDDRWNPSSGVLYEGAVVLGTVSQGQESRGTQAIQPGSGAFYPSGQAVVICVWIPRCACDTDRGRVCRGTPAAGWDAKPEGLSRRAFFWPHRGVWANLEWRFLPGRRSRTFFFVDLGYLDGANSTVLFPVGYGAGLRMTSRLGWMGLDLRTCPGRWSPGTGQKYTFKW